MTGRHPIYLALLLLALPFPAGCQEQARRAVTQPAVRTEPTTESPQTPASGPAASDETTAATGRKAERSSSAQAKPGPVAAEKRTPRRPVDSWVIFREAFEPGKDATCTTEWTGVNRLEVHTDNISRITLDLTRLPPGAPAKGPWNLQIDGQGIEITGFQPKPGYTGKIRDLVRSDNGNWTVDRKKLYKE